MKLVIEFVLSDMLDSIFGLVTTVSKLVTLDKLPVYNPEEENHYDFHLRLCMLADIDDKGTLDRFELAKVHAYFNAAYELWRLTNQCPSMTDAEKQLAIANTETRMHSWAEFVNCTAESKEEWHILTRKNYDGKLSSPFAAAQYRDKVPFADYIERLGWKKSTASAD